MLNIEDKIDKLKKLIKVKTNIALAEYLGVEQSTIGKWISRNYIDYSIIIEKFPNINLNWLIYDDGEPYYTETSKIISDCHKKIAELEYLLKKTDAENGKDASHVSALAEVVADSDSEINNLKIKIDILEEMLLKLAKSVP